MSDKYRILIIEDNPDLLEMYRALLEKDDYKLSLAMSAADGFAELGIDRFDLVLLDLFLPGMDGLEVLRRIRQMNKDIPVIVITANMDSSVQRRCEQLGASAYLAKPVGIKRLVQTVESFLDYPSGKRQREWLQAQRHSG